MNSLMSSEPGSQYMAQPNQQNISIDPSATVVKRKRGRPKKDKVSGSVPSRRNQGRRALPISSSVHGFVGQEVLGVLDGVFDAGYLLTVKVDGSGPIMKGVVFDPCLAVPIAAENDLAPHLPMLKGDAISNPVNNNFTNQQAFSSQGHMMQKGNNLQNSPPSSTKEVTPGNNSHGPQVPDNVCKNSAGSKTLDASNTVDVSKVSSLNLSCPLVHQRSDVSGVVTSKFFENEPIINDSKLSVVSEEDTDPKEAPSIVYNPSDVSQVRVSVFAQKIIADATEVSEQHNGKTVGSTAKENVSLQRFGVPSQNSKDNESSLEIIKGSQSEGQMAGFMGTAE